MKISASSLESFDFFLSLMPENIFMAIESLIIVI